MIILFTCLIAAFTASFLKYMREGRSPSISMNKFQNYCSNPNATCCCSSDLANGQEIIALMNKCHVRRINVFLRVLVIIQQLLQENKHGSKRDIYYTHPSVYTEQSVVDWAINDTHPSSMQSSQPECDIVSVAEYILLVERESGETLIFRWGDKEFLSSYFFYLDEIFSCNVGAAVFQPLANDHFCDSNRCIVITGRGYPDIPTRSKWPTTQNFCVSRGYIGLELFLWTSINTLPKHCLPPLTTEDKRRTETLLDRCYLQRSATLEVGATDNTAKRSEI